MKVKVSNPTTKPSQAVNPSEESNNFIFNCRNYQYSIPQLRSFLSQEYARLFPQKPYPEGQPLKLVKIAVGYELLYQGYLRAGLPIPSKVSNNRNASINFKPEQLTPMLRSLVEVDRESLEGEQLTMKTAKVVLKKKKPKTQEEAQTPVQKGKPPVEKKKSVTQAYVELFEQFPNTKTDAELATLMCRAFPMKKKYTSKDISQVRSLFNHGKLKGQKGIPKVLAERVEISK